MLKYLFICVFVQAAAALCISVGSFSDPDDLPGFAHFLEHSESSKVKSEKKQKVFI